MDPGTKAVAREVSASLRRAADAVRIGDLSDREVLDLIRQSPLTDRFMVEARAAIKRQRTELVAKKRRAQAAAERAAPTLMQALQERRTIVAAQIEALRAAQAAEFEADLAMKQSEVSVRRVVSDCDFTLESLAPKEIDEFIARCAQAAEQLRTRGLVGQLDDTRDVYRQTNECLEQLGRAIQEAAALKLTDLDGEDLRAALERIESKTLRDAAP
jgi:hypothetical protein